MRRHKTYLVIFFTFFLYINTLASVQGPPTDKKKVTEDESSESTKDKEYIAHVYKEDPGEVSALKIVPAPDLSKERERRKGEDTGSEETTESADILMIQQAKWLQKMVQEIGGIQYTIVSDSQEVEATIDEEELPPVLEPLPEKQLTPEEIEGA